MDTENPAAGPRVPSYLPPPIYRTAPVPGEVVEMSSLLGEACARWPTTVTAPATDESAGPLSDYSAICHVVARPDRVDEDMQTVGLMGVGFGLALAIVVVLIWSAVRFLCRHRSDGAVMKARREADAAAVMQWSAQTAVSRLRTVGDLKDRGREVNRTVEK
jgi:hypothetical protein